MNPCAAAVIAARPTAGEPSLIVSEPSGEKNAATLAAFRLHHAAVYRTAKLFIASSFIRLSPPAM